MSDDDPRPKWMKMADRAGLLGSSAFIRPLDVKPPVNPVALSSKKTADGVARMVELTELNVEIAKAAQKDAAETKTFSKRMTWASLIISIVGVGIAIASFAVAIAGHH